MPERQTWLNGRFVPERDARVSIYDSALTHGDMAFEVTRTVDHRPFHLDDHLQRLDRTLRALAIETGMSHEALRRATLQTLERNLPLAPREIDWNIIHNVSRGPAGPFAAAFAPAERVPTIIISCFPLAARLAAESLHYERGLDLVVPAQRSLPPELLDPTVKTRSRLHYQLANLQASQKSPGAGALLLDPSGHVTEGTSGNFFIVEQSKLFTPRGACVLPGITRSIVLELAGQSGMIASETDITLDRALSADEAFVTATSTGVLHVRSLEGRLFGAGQAGPITLGLRAAFHEHAGLDFAVQARMYAARPELCAV